MPLSARVEASPVVAGEADERERMEEEAIAVIEGAPGSVLPVVIQEACQIRAGIPVVPRNSLNIRDLSGLSRLASAQRQRCCGLAAGDVAGRGGG
ncbi:hypothetical protein, partial [Novosphingobium nitrogenifigens]|uniref:hypothetical protein n=1 Tax=Novosphingobium nitrogenifigens TaxID=378548 RepID=UPI001E3BF9F7